jgi:DNA polymerase-3 subunit epsilon
MKLYALPGIQFPYICSLRVSRKTLPQIGSLALDAVAEHLGFTFKHHDALEDAIACAKIIAQVGFPMTPKICLSFRKTIKQYKECQPA